MKLSKPKEVLVFDFDGVLAIPYTHPEECYSDVVELMTMLKEEYILCVASYNPRAEVAIESWGIRDLFSVVLCGANYVWKGKEYDDKDRVEMRKDRQIVSIIKKELDELQIRYDQVAFFDDDQENIDLVTKELPSVTCTFIDNKKGIQLEDIVNCI